MISTSEEIAQDYEGQSLKAVKLKGVEPWTFVQKQGDAVFIQAGCPHQVRNSFSVKVADFGLSRLFPLEATHVSTAPQGTPRYVNPEYHECYQLTDKSDEPYVVCSGAILAVWGS
ncbi:hypothetical protein AgCh_020461 [Apium graveolens]